MEGGEASVIDPHQGTSVTDPHQEISMTDHHPEILIDLHPETLVTDHLETVLMTDVDHHQKVSRQEEIPLTEMEGDPLPEETMTETGSLIETDTQHPQRDGVGITLHPHPGD